MKIQKVITLMGDRLRLSFFVKESHLFDSELPMMWFEDEYGNEVLGDSYHYYLDDNNKIEIPDC